MRRHGYDKWQWCAKDVRTISSYSCLAGCFMLPSIRLSSLNTYPSHQQLGIEAPYRHPSHSGLPKGAGNVAVEGNVLEFPPLSHNNCHRRAARQED